MQTIVKLLGGIYPPIPPGFSTPGQGATELATQIEMPPLIKIMTTKPIVASVSFFLAFLPTAVPVINNNSNSGDHEFRAPSIQIFTNQFKCIIREKFRTFFLKVTTSNPYLYRFYELYAIA